MRIILLYLGLLNSTLFAQEFTRVYFPDNPQYPMEIRDVQQLSDGNFIAGYDLRNSDSLSYPRAGIMKLDNNGVVIWSKTLDIPNASASCSYEVAERSNGNYYLFGLALNDSLSGNDSLTIVMDPYLSEFDQNGNLVYYKSYEGATTGGAYSVNSMEILPSDSLAFLVSVNNYVELFKTDADGERDWVTRTSNLASLTAKNPGFDFVYLPDNTYLVVCKSYSDLCIIKYDNVGNVMWTRFHRIANYSHLKSLCLTASGDLYALGYATDFGAPYNAYPILLQLDPNNGDIVMARSLPSLGFNYLSMAELKEDNGTLLISLSGPTLSSIFEEHYVIRTDYQGNLIEGMYSDNVILNYNNLDVFDTSYTISGNMYFYSYEGFIQHTDDPLLGCNYSEFDVMLTIDFTDYYDTLHPFVSIPTGPYHDVPVTTINVNMTDSLICENLSVPFQKEIEFEAYPNPVNDIVLIQLGAHFQLPARLQLSNLQGKIMINEFIFDNQEQFDLSHLQSGTYLLKVFNDQQVLSTKLVVN